LAHATTHTVAAIDTEIESIGLPAGVWLALPGIGSLGAFADRARTWTAAFAVDIERLLFSVVEGSVSLTETVAWSIIDGVAKSVWPKIILGGAFVSVVFIVELRSATIPSADVEERGTAASFCSSQECEECKHGSKKTTVRVRILATALLDLK
jgi:hypothetical protein